MQERVQRGFTWLKEEGPAHGLIWERVRIHHLHMGSNVLCVLAQSSLDSGGTFAEIVTGVVGSRNGALEWADAHGFTSPDGDAVGLTAEWVRVLTEARDQQDLAEALLVS
jgi:hypothetical protein